MIRCYRCGEPLDVLGAHDDPETGHGVCEECCAACDPTLAEAWGIHIDITTDDQRAWLDGTRDPARDDDGDPLIAGHGVLSRVGIERAQEHHG